MNQTSEKSKDWDRHARVFSLLQGKRANISRLALSIKEPVSHVSACIWGKPSRKNKRIEEKIAVYLGCDRNSLFKDD
jgi:hypothetical protein